MGFGFFRCWRLSEVAGTGVGGAQGLRIIVQFQV